MNKKDIPIFYTVDNNYIPYLSVSIESLIDNTNDKNNYKIFIIHEDLTKDSIMKIKKLEKNNISIEFINMEDIIKPLKEKLNVMVTKTHFPITVYFRLFIPTMFDGYDKGIYIDSDTVLNADIAELYAYDLKDNLFGGIVDKSVLDTPFVHHYEQYSGISRYKYINSGVLLMNMKKLRDVNFENKFLYILNKYDFEVVDPDQVYINNLSKDRILYIGEEWNAMPVKGRKGLDNPKLIHYNLFLKPWHYDDVEYQEYFWKYAKKSAFYDEIKKVLDNYTEEDKLNDDRILQNMVKQADRLNKKEVTFKSVFESGLETRLDEVSV